MGPLGLRTPCSLLLDESLTEDSGHFGLSFQILKHILELPRSLESELEA